MEKNKGSSRRNTAKDFRAGRGNTQKKENNFIVQGSILAVTSILVRLIGIFYRVPLINIIGDQGMAYYMTAFNMYSIMLLLSSYSLPLAVSKMIAARVARGEFKNSRRILKASLFYATLVGAAGAVIIWFGADFFANQIFQAPFCVYALKSLAPAVWVMAYLGVFRGYFQGLGTMMPTAFSQVFEQIVNAIVSVGAAAVLFKLGHQSNLVYDATQYPYAFGAAGSTIGTGAGALTALLFLLFILFVYRKTNKRMLRRDQTQYVEGYGEIARILFLTVVPVILSTAVYNFSSVLDNAVFNNGMKKLGQDYITVWGVYTGKYQMLVNVPLAVANSLSASLIPALSMAVSSRNRTQIKDRVAVTIRFAMIVAIPSAVGLAVLAGPVNDLLFAGDNSLSIRLTMAGSLSVIFFSLSTVTNAILQGLNRMRVPIMHAIVSLVIHIGLLYLMLMVFQWGIYSVLIANILFGFCMCILNGLAIRRYLRYRQEIKKTFVLPVIAAGVMGVAAYGLYRGVYFISASNLVGTLIAIAAAIPVYGVLLIKLRCVDEVELYGMPGGGRLVLISHKLHLLP